ncbi:hypothetical protein Tco_0752153 [Tanacetum coccineum]|uniref:Uncharacterized protein n=1 Tax=Tanacetum coccineum TaxID=301880 RepID=A0ABQ4Z8T7_9ASTR
MVPLRYNKTRLWLQGCFWSVASDGWRAERDLCFPRGLSFCVGVTGIRDCVGTSGHLDGVFASTARGARVTRGTTLREEGGFYDEVDDSRLRGVLIRRWVGCPGLVLGWRGWLIGKGRVVEVGQAGGEGGWGGVGGGVGSVWEWEVLGGKLGVGFRSDSGGIAVVFWGFTCRDRGVRVWDGGCGGWDGGEWGWGRLGASCTGGACEGVQSNEMDVGYGCGIRVGRSGGLDVGMEGGGCLEGEYSVER